MALPPLLKRRAPESVDTRPADAPPQQERTRARRRLIGAAVLLVVGVIAFPVLFESQPRPVPVNVPMAIPSPESAAPLSLPSRTPRVVSGTIGEAAQAASGVPAPASAVLPLPSPDAVAPAKTATLTTPAPVPTPAAAVKEATKKSEEPEKTKKAAERVAEKPSAKAAEKPVDKPVEKTAAATKPALSAAAVATASKSARYVVQVGAYADDTSAKEVRARVERLGLKTFTQDVEVQGARRIRVRVGPFESQDEAAKALATLKAGKLPGVVLTL
jgi:DedD protein